MIVGTIFVMSFYIGKEMGLERWSDLPKFSYWVVEPDFESMLCFNYWVSFIKHCIRVSAKLQWLK